MKAIEQSAFIYPNTETSNLKLDSKYIYMPRKFELIYIIDDDVIFVKITTRLLQLSGICDNFLVFKNGQEALDYIKPRLLHSEPLADMILLDINMPVMDGWEFLDNLQKVPNSDKLNINLISSSIDPLDIQKAESYDLIKNFLTKPISVDKLKSLSIVNNS
jgi:CheY-like chemotaxis protein